MMNPAGHFYLKKYEKSEKIEIKKKYLRVRSILYFSVKFFLSKYVSAKFGTNSKI